MASHKTFTHNVSRGRARHTAGFTLMEVIIVIGLLAFIGGLALITSMDDYRGYSFRSEQETFIAILQRARSQAVNNMCFSYSGYTCTNGKAHGVHVSGGQYTLFQGSAWASRDTPIDEVVVPKSATVSVTAVPGDLIFTPLSGVVATPITYTMTDGLGHTSTIKVHSEGRICSDDSTC